MSERFGDGYIVKESKSGKFALLKFEANTGDSGKVEDLTDDQIRDMDIMLFNTEKEARDHLHEIIMDSITPNRTSR